MSMHEEELSPAAIVAELDRYIIGQDAAKRAVAVALRNRWRRQRLPEELRDEVAPKNIIMIGPTGVGKTEIARRLARLAQAPFIKVEATRFTEVGYVGRDVESMVRDLVDIAVDMVRARRYEELADDAAAAAEERLLDILLPPRRGRRRKVEEGEDPEASYRRAREKLRRQLREGELDDRIVEIETTDQYLPPVEVFGPQGLEEVDIPFQELFGRFMQGRTKVRRVRVEEALRLLEQEEAANLLDMDDVVREAIERVENSGIIFIDELDKIATRESRGSGPDVSREGVQRDILPIVEGTSVATRYGMVRTDHILFLAAGAFHLTRPSDLIPELQGRFPIRVELSPLTEADFRRILTEPENALVRQYVELLATEGVELVFTDDALDEIARVAAQVNRTTEDIGARRLHTVLERVLEEVSFNAPDNVPPRVVIDVDYVRERLREVLASEDLSRYIL